MKKMTEKGSVHQESLKICGLALSGACSKPSGRVWLFLVVMSVEKSEAISLNVTEVPPVIL